MLEHEQLSGQIIGAAIEVHRILGPGLLEPAYQSCLAREFSIRGIPFQKELKVPIEYKGVRVEPGYRLDFIVDHVVVVEVKAVETVLPVHEAPIADVPQAHETSRRTDHQLQCACPQRGNHPSRQHPLRVISASQRLRCEFISHSPEKHSLVPKLRLGNTDSAKLCFAMSETEFRESAFPSRVWGRGHVEDRQQPGNTKVSSAKPLCLCDSAVNSFLGRRQKTGDK